MTTWADLTNEQQMAAATAFGRGRSYGELAGEYGIDPDARACFERKVREGARWLRIQAEYHETHVDDAPEQARRWTDFSTVEGDHLILADAHVPFHDAAWINRCIALAKRYGIQRVGIAGDLFDQSVFSAFGRTPGIEWRDERNAALQAVRVMLSQFEMVTICQGNHERRVIRAVQHALDEEDWQDMVFGDMRDNPRLNVTPYHWFIVESGGQSYRVTHPRNASIQPTSVGERLARKYDMHVITAHGHLNGLRRDYGDRLWVIDMGMCADPLRLDYVNTEDNVRPLMQQGAVMIVAGAPLLLTPANIAVYEMMAK